MLARKQWLQPAPKAIHSGIHGFFTCAGSNNLAGMLIY
jgi:hypothetical protein